MGKIETYDKLDDFIFATKDKSIKKIFFKFMTNSQKLSLQDNAGKEVAGYKHIISAYVSAISDDGKAFITCEQPLSELIQTPQTKDEDFKTFNDNATLSMKKDIIEALQRDYSTADLKAGSCAPSVA